ncbi:MAG TPA: helix-turn-helix domain-containing protein [Mucilaginibacter sp.]|jgi:hypothetical protein
MAVIDFITRQDLEKFKQELFAELKALGKINTPDEAAKKWLKGSEVRKMLKISSGTLQKLRINGTIKFTKIDTLYYYKYEDIVKLLEKNQQGGWANDR